MQAEAAFWGIPPELLSDLPQDEAVWPWHVPAVEAFLAVRDQWRLIQQIDAQGQLCTVVLGLDLPAVEAGLRLAGIDMTPGLWTQVQAIAEGAREALNGD